jgi:hypothetical protein
MVLLAKSDAQDPSARLLLMLFALKMHLALPLFLHFVKVARQRRRQTLELAAERKDAKKQISERAAYLF